MQRPLQQEGGEDGGFFAPKATGSQSGVGQSKTNCHYWAALVQP
jgi:hypothetical protein